MQPGIIEDGRLDKVAEGLGADGLHEVLRKLLKLPDADRTVARSAWMEAARLRQVARGSSGPLPVRRGSAERLREIVAATQAMVAGDDRPALALRRDFGAAGPKG
jgi:hypothetical protein